MNIKKLLNLQSSQEKIAEYKGLLQKSYQLEGKVEELYQEFAQQSDIMKSISTLGEEERKEAMTRHNSFLSEHTQKVAALQKEKAKLEKSMTRLEGDDDIYEAIIDVRFLADVKQNCRRGKISKSVYNEIIKAKAGRVRYADVLLFRGEKLLILQRAGEKGSHTDEWCVPGGHVDIGEDYRDAAARELFEETGFEVPADMLQEVAVATGKDFDIHYFIGHIDQDAPAMVLVDGEEEIGSEWIYINEIEDYDFIFDMKDNLKKILGLEIKPNMVPNITKAYAEGKISEEIFKAFCDNHKEDIKKANNKTYFSHKERKDLAEKGEAMPNGKYPIRNSQDLKDAIRLVGASSMPESEVKAWIKKRAKALGLTDELPESWGEHDVEKSYIPEEERKEDAKKGIAMPGGEFPIGDEHQLRSAIKLRNNSNLSEASVKRHIIKRAKALHLENLLPEEWKEDKKVEKTMDCDDANAICKEDLEGGEKKIVKSAENDLEGFSVLVNFNDLDQADMFKSIVSEMKESGKLDVDSVEAISKSRMSKPVGSLKIWKGREYIKTLKGWRPKHVKDDSEEAENEGDKKKTSNSKESKKANASLSKSAGEEAVEDMDADEFEKAHDILRGTFVDFANFLEGAKTRTKNIHWKELDNSKHEYLDDLTDVLSEYEDKIMEAGQSGFGRFKDGEINGEEIKVNDPVEFIDLIIDRGKEFHEAIKDNLDYVGEMSWMEDFLAELKQTKYRLQMH